jgi:hypothetical protein
MRRVVGIGLSQFDNPVAQFISAEMACIGNADQIREQVVAGRLAGDFNPSSHIFQKVFKTFRDVQCGFGVSSVDLLHDL